MLAQNISLYLQVCFLIGILPFFNQKTKKFQVIATLPLVLILATTIAVILQIIRFYLGFEKIGILSGAIQPFMDVTLNVQTILNSNFFRTEALQHLFDVFDSFDRDVIMIHKTQAPKIRHLKLDFLMLNVVFFGMNIIHALLWKLPILDRILYYVGNDFSCYNIHINEFLKILLIHSIKQRFQLTNTLLAQKEMSGLGKHRIEGYIKLHQKCCDMVDAFNRIYGWNIWISIWQTIVYILRLVNMILSGVKSYEIYFNLMWTVYSVIQAVAVTTMCEQVVDEGKNCIVISYKAIRDYINVPVVKDKLMVLAQQAGARRPRFSAAGFFDVDFAMLFTFLNLITTYVIVIIQFSPSGSATIG